MEPIRRMGLLPASELLALFGVAGDERRRLEEEPRPAGVPLTHPVHGTATLNDNAPLGTAALAGCLDDGLTPADWMRELNRRVFFWPDRDAVTALLGAPLNRYRARAVLVIDTLGLALRHGDRVTVSPINSGAAVRRPARRGLATFVPLHTLELSRWRTPGGARRRIREVTIAGTVPDIGAHILAVEHVPGLVRPRPTRAARDATSKD